MTAASRSKPPTANDPRRADLKDRARAVFGGLFWYAATAFAGAFFLRQPIAAAGVQAAIAEWGTGMLGVAWTDPHGPEATPLDAAKRALRGAAMGLGAAAIVVATAVVMRAAVPAKVHAAPSAVLVGLLVPLLVSVRDELLLRGLVLRVTAAAPRAAQLVACGLASVASVLGASATGASPAELAVAGLSGVAFGALWQRDRGAWMAWGAHAAWAWGVRAVASGYFDPASTLWGGGDAGIAGGGVAALVAGLAAVAAVAWSSRVPSPHT